MALPMRLRPDAAPRTRPNRVLYDVVQATASSDPCLEFPLERPEEIGVRKPIFIIVPVPGEPRSSAAQGRPHDRVFSRSQNITADDGLFRPLFRSVLSVPRLLVMGTFLALHHGVMGTLLALRRVVVGALLALHRGAVASLIMARRTTSAGARWTWRCWAVVIAGTKSIGVSGVSRFRRLGGDVRTRRRAISRRCGAATALLRARLTREVGTIARGMSMVGHDLTVVGRSLREEIRNAQRIAIANLGMRRPFSPLRISRVRVPVTNVRLVALAGGTAVCALVMWMFGVQPDLARLTDGTDRGVAPVPGVVAAEPSAGDSLATIYTARSGTSPGNQQSTTPSSVSASMVVMSSAMTVTSTPSGARVTVNGIGWGETPVTIRHLPPGQKVVRVTKEGYESQQRIISVPDDRRSDAVRVTLRARS